MKIVDDLQWLQVKDSRDAQLRLLFEKLTPLAARVVDNQWYGFSEESLQKALALLEKHGYYPGETVHG